MSWPCKDTQEGPLRGRREVYQLRPVLGALPEQAYPPVEADTEGGDECLGEEAWREMSPAVVESILDRSPAEMGSSLVAVGSFRRSTGEGFW